MTEVFVLESEASTTDELCKSLPPHVGAWTRFGSSILVHGATQEQIEAGAATAQAAMRRFGAAQPKRMRLVAQEGRAFQQRFPDTGVVLDRGRYLVADISEEEEERINQAAAAQFTIGPLPIGGAVFTAHTRRQTVRKAIPAVQACVERVSAQRCREHVEKLSGFHTRHSFRPEFRAAAEWAGGVLAALGFVTREDIVTVGNRETVNVVAERKGTSADPNRRIVIATAHLDSVNHEGTESSIAPGADDNASGSAGVLEIAEALHNAECEHDLRFILFGGEEQGLHGSLAYVAGLSTAERARVHTVINMDMIGRLNTPQNTVLLEGAPLSQDLIDRLAEAAETYTQLEVQTSLNPFNSDHVPFIDEGMPAVLTIEGADTANNHVHSDEDVIEDLDFSLMAEILRMNVAIISEACGAR